VDTVRRTTGGSGPCPGRCPARSSVPSVALQGQAEKVLVGGVLSIILGWTVVVPLFTVVQYTDTANAARKENVATPGKATAGLVLALLFGSVQILTLIAKLVK